jgi:acetyl-CoA synthetase
MLRSRGIGKGDMVMVILKRHYQFWFTILALHKLGAVIIPATFLLTKHDIVYRANAAGVKAIICTGEGDTAEHIDSALPECPTVQFKLMVNGSREGWGDFMAEMEAADEKFERVQTQCEEPMILYFSSGTTGNPKMALHSYTYALSHLTTAKYWQNVRPDGIHRTIAEYRLGKGCLG